MGRRARMALAVGALTFAISHAVTPATQGAEATIVSLGFDDTLASQYQARSMLATHGMNATFYANSGRVSEPGYLARAQLRDLQQDGNEIAGHTVHHLDLLSVDRDEQRRQICNDRQTLTNWGLAATSFAYPFGRDSAQLAEVVRECGYNAGRDHGGISGGGSHAEPLPPADPYAIKTYKGDSKSLAELQNAVTRVEDGGGGWLVIDFHHICDACGAQAISPSTLGSFLAWLATRETSGTSVKTLGEVIGGVVEPPVPGPPPPPVRSGNMLNNRSLELDTNADAVPDCWLRNSWGSSKSTWTRTPDAHSGGFAERLDVTTYSSGAVRLLSAHDLGYCAPSAIPGHAYRLSAWYKGSARPRLVAFYRTATGAWRVLGQSSRLTRSTTWRRGSWTAPPLPAGANGIGLGLALESTGTLTIDDLAVSDSSP